MAGGRYPDMNNVQPHPNAEQGQEALANQTEMHQQIAEDLRPAGLRRAVRKEWERLAPLLSAQSRLKAHFVDVVVEYCELKVRLKAARKMLDKEDWTYSPGGGRNGNQLRNRPEVAQLNDDWRKWNSLVAQLGLSPGAELRFNDTQGDLFKDRDNPFSQI